MRKLMAVLIVLGLSASYGLALPQSSSAAQNSEQTEKEKEKQEKQEKKDKKNKAKKDKKAKDDKNSGPQDVVNTEVFSQAVANDVLGQVRDGLEGHSSRL